MELLVGTCYRSPSSSEENNREPAELVSKALHKPHITHILIFGDYNYPHLTGDILMRTLIKKVNYSMTVAYCCIL